MAEHDDHEMHENSLEAYARENQLGRLSRRRAQILTVYLMARRALTDRQVCRALKFEDPNKARPRINEMIEDGILEECGTAIDETTQHKVRLVRLRPRERRPPVQAGLF